VGDPGRALVLTHPSSGTVRGMPWVVGVTVAAGIGACAPERSALPGPADVAMLEETTRHIHRAMLVENRMDQFDAVAAPEYVAMIPGGRLEDRAEVVAGAVNFDVDSVEIRDLITRMHEHTAVVTGAWTVFGKLRDRDMSGEYRFLVTYERGAGGWRLVAESVTRAQDLMGAVGAPR